MKAPDRRPPGRTRRAQTPFRPHGRVTAGNSSGLNDGATAAVFAAEETADELGLSKKLRLVSYAFVGVDPAVMGVGPVPATEKALAKAGLSIDDIGAFELNEAFAVQVLALLDHYGIADDDACVNPMGGSIAVGHPLASSGVRLLTYLARDFEDNPNVRYGLTSMCGSWPRRHRHLGKPQLPGLREQPPCLKLQQSLTRLSPRQSFVTSTCRLAPELPP